MHIRSEYKRTFNLPFGVFYITLISIQIMVEIAKETGNRIDNNQI